MGVNKDTLMAIKVLMELEQTIPAASARAKALHLHSADMGLQHAIPTAWQPVSTTSAS